MAYQVITTFTRDNSSVEWPFWAASLSGTAYETAADSFMQWNDSRTDVDVTYNTTQENEVSVVMTFADEDAHTLWEADRLSAGHGDYLTLPEVTNYCSANNITISYTTQIT